METFRGFYIDYNLRLVPIIMRLQIYPMVMHQRSGGGVPSRLVLKPLEPNLMFDVGAHHVAEYAAPIFVGPWPMLRELLQRDWFEVRGFCK